MDERTSERLQREADSKLLLNEEASAFMHTPIYEKFMRAAERESMVAMDVLRRADPYSEPRKVAEAQEALRFAEKFPNWILRVIVEGEQEMQMRLSMEQHQEGQE